MMRIVLLACLGMCALVSACPNNGNPCVARFQFRTWSPSVCSRSCSRAGYNNYCHNPYGQGLCYCHERYGQCGCGSASYNGLPASCGYNAVEKLSATAAAAAAAEENLGAVVSVKAESDIVSMVAAPEAKGASPLVVDLHRHCSLETTGTCRVFGCTAARGETNCIGGKCMCTLGNCATSDGSTCMPQCNTMTTGSCRVFGCSGSRGAAQCVSGKCVCQAGYCATGDGESCVQSNPDVSVAMEAASPQKSQPLMLALFIGIAAGFVSTAVVLLGWARYSRNLADDQAYIQIE